MKGDDANANGNAEAPAAAMKECTCAAATATDDDDVNCECEDLLPEERLDDVREQIVTAVGGFGRWQLIKCSFIMAIIWIGASFHLLNMVFFRAETDFWCSKPDQRENWSEQRWRNLSSPDGDSCQVYDVEYESFSTLDELESSPAYQSAKADSKMRACSSWTYDRSRWHRTIIQEWDLVCQREDMQKLTQQATFFGLLIGAFASGLISDRFGRVPAMLLLILANVVAGTVAVFVPSYSLFLVCVWACGFCAIGSGTVMYCWMMELLAGRPKTVFGCLPHINYAFWGLGVALMAYLLPDWRHMELVFSLPYILLLCLYFVLPESPRWLIAHNRLDEAERILRRIAKFNGKPLPDSFKVHAHTHAQGQSEQKGKGLLGFLELFKTPNLRKKTLIIYYMWFTTAIVYYGLTLNSNKIGDADLITVFSLGKLMEFPAIAIVITLLLTAGRRMTLMLLYGLCGISLLSTVLVQGVSSSNWPIVMLNVLGRGCSTGTLAICYVYSAECYPTVIRNIGIGSSSVWARVGPMIAPYIADLRVYHELLPVSIFGAMALIACFLVTFLPETTHHKLPDTVEEGEKLGKGDTFWSSLRKAKSKKHSSYSPNNEEDVKKNCQLTQL